MTVLDERFPRWMETIELEPTPGRRFAALREAADAVGSTVDPRTAFGLVEYAVGLGSDVAFHVVVTAVSEHDRTFSAAATDLEPRLVASAALARMLEGSGLPSAVAAGALLSAEFAGLASPVDELPALARAAVVRRFETLRGRLEPVPFGRTRTESSFRAPPGTVGALADDFTRRLALLEQRMQTRLDAAHEELDILWWAMGARAVDEDLRWRARDSTEVLLRTGRELAARHRFHSELPSAIELLQRVLGPLAEEEHTLVEVVPAAAEEVAAAGIKHVTAAGIQSGPLLPILTSAAAYLAGGDDDLFSFDADSSWIESARSHDVDPTISRRGDAIALQTTRELLLAAALGDG